MNYITWAVIGIVLLAALAGLVVAGVSLDIWYHNYLHSMGSH